MAEKRNVHSYKVTDKVYRKAMRRAKKDPKTLSERIEEFVINYANYKELPLYNTAAILSDTVLYTDIPLTKSTKAANKKTINK